MSLYARLDAMMRTLGLCLTFALLIVSSTALHAQEDVPFADLDPEAIFADGVEVVGVRYDVWSRNKRDASAQVSIDNDARVIRVFQMGIGEWQEFQFPPEIETLETVMKRSDGTFLFNHDVGRRNLGGAPPLNPHQPVLALWNFDPATGAFTPAEIICGGYARQLPGDGTWVEYTDSRVNRTALCNTESGELQRIAADSGTQIGSSQDGAWEVYSIYTPGNPGVAEIYSIERGTGRELHLGTVENPAFGGISDYWASATRGFIFDNEMPESWKHHLLTFDITEADSLEYLMPGWAEYYDNPARFELLNTY